MGFNVKNVIIFGHIQFITDESLAIKEVRAMAMKYFDRVYADEKIKKSMKYIQILQLTIDNMTVKLVNES